MYQLDGSGHRLRDAIHLRWVARSRLICDLAT